MNIGSGKMKFIKQITLKEGDTVEYEGHGYPFVEVLEMCGLVSLLAGPDEYVYAPFWKCEIVE